MKNKEKYAKKQARKAWVHLWKCERVRNSKGKIKYEDIILNYLTLVEFDFYWKNYRNLPSLNYDKLYLTLSQNE
jgi:hypothetical protein